MTRIAVVEDDAAVNKQLCGWIQKASPAAQIDAWHSKHDAVAALQRERYDLVTLDVELGMYALGGFGVLREITKDVPVIVISGYDKGDGQGILTEFQTWFLRKPCNEAAVIQHVLLALDSRKKPKPSLLIRDTRCRARWFWKDRDVRLTETERYIVTDIYERRDTPNSVVSHDELKEYLITGQNASLYTHISRIKDKFWRIDRSFSCIVSIRLKGYQWLEEATK